MRVTADQLDGGWRLPPTDTERNGTYGEVSPLRADLEEPEPPDLVQPRVLILAVIPGTEALHQPCQARQNTQKLGETPHLFDGIIWALAHKILNNGEGAALVCVNDRADRGATPARTFLIYLA